MGGRVVASVPTSKVMDVYNGFAAVVNPAIPNKMFSMVNPLDANAAAKAFYEFKDVVKAAQRCTELEVFCIVDVWAWTFSPHLLQNPLDANATAKAFYEFKDVVKAAQGCSEYGRSVRTYSKFSSG